MPDCANCGHLLPGFAVKGLNNYTIGVLGGMGSYATLHFFERLLDSFDVEKEWQRPRIIIDNNCVLPSRTRAILYDELRPELVTGMADSLRRLSGYGVDAIAMPCNTAHCFLPEVRAQLDGEDAALIDMLGLVASASSKGRWTVLATEGTVATRVYEQYLEPVGVEVDYGDETLQKESRHWIEVVKQKQAIDHSGYHAFLRRAGERVVLGCTELSVLDAACGAPDDVAVLDPIGLMVRELHSRATA